MGMYDLISDIKRKEFAVGNRIESLISSNDLTEGKVYFVRYTKIHYSGMKMLVWIINDNDDHTAYDSEYFISLKEGRRLKLNKLNLYKG